MNQPLNNTVKLFDAIYAEDEYKKKDSDLGVYTISLVDKPAIIAQFMAFSALQAQNFHFIETDKKRRIITGPVMIPDMPIKRIDDEAGSVTGIPKGEYFIKFSADVVERTVWGRAIKPSLGINLMHESKLLPEKSVFMFESWYTDSERGVLKPRDYKECPNKTWFASFKIEDEVLYNDLVKTGLLTGFSVECNYGLKLVGDKNKAIMEGLERITGNRNK